MTGLYWNIKILICTTLYGGIEGLAPHMEWYARSVTFIVISIILGLGIWFMLSIGLSVRRIFKVDFIAQFEDKTFAGRGKRFKRGKKWQK